MISLLKIFVLVELFCISLCYVQKTNQIYSYSTDLTFFVEYIIPDSQNLWVILQTQYNGPGIDSVKEIQKQIKVLKAFVQKKNYQISLYQIKNFLNQNDTNFTDQSANKIGQFQLIFDQINIQITHHVSLYQQLYVRVPSITKLGIFIDQILELKQKESLNFNILEINWFDHVNFTPDISQILENKYTKYALQISKQKAVQMCRLLNMQLASMNQFQQVQLDTKDIYEDQKQKNSNQDKQIDPGQSCEQKLFTYEEALEKIIQQNSLLYENRFYKVYVTCTGKKSSFQIKSSMNDKKHKKGKPTMKSVSKGQELERQLRNSKNIKK